VASKSLLKKFDADLAALEAVAAGKAAAVAVRGRGYDTDQLRRALEHVLIPFTLASAEDEAGWMEDRECLEFFSPWWQALRLLSRIAHLHTYYQRLDEGVTAGVWAWYDQLRATAEDASGNIPLPAWNPVGPIISTRPPMSSTCSSG
jgi:hypothetical protein